MQTLHIQWFSSHKTQVSASWNVTLQIIHPNYSTFFRIRYCRSSWPNDLIVLLEKNKWTDSGVICKSLIHWVSRIILDSRVSNCDVFLSGEVEDTTAHSYSDDSESSYKFIIPRSLILTDLTCEGGSSWTECSESEKCSIGILFLLRLPPSGSSTVYSVYPS